MGLRPLCLAAVTRDKPDAADGVPRPEAFYGHAYRERHGLSLSAGGEKGLSVPDPERGNDRSFNLQLYYAATSANFVCLTRRRLSLSLYGSQDGTCHPAPACCASGHLELHLRSAGLRGNPRRFPATWPTDNRDGGVPDPATAGPQMILIGTESGFLPAPVVLPNQPITFDAVGNVADKTLLLMPAERADVIIDFINAPLGSTIILYNDAPAALPGGDPRYDYYTGNPDQTVSGGAPSTLAGFGPNIRTIMQFRVTNAATTARSLRQ